MGQILAAFHFRALRFVGWTEAIYSALAHRRDTVRKELVVVLLVLVFVAGFFLGRAFPGRHYDKYGNGPLLVNTSTGKVCNPLKPFQQAARDSDSPFKDLGGHPVPTVSELKDLNTYVPSCGEE